MPQVARCRFWTSGALALLLAAAAPVDARAGRLDAYNPAAASGQRSAVAYAPRPSRNLRRATPAKRAESRKESGKRQRKSSAPILRVEAPAYYDYRADPIAAVNFQPLLERPQAVALQSDAASFTDALPGLAGFSLAAEAPIAEALLAHYGDDPKFIWVGEFGPNERALEALRVLSEADAFGLSARDYAVASPSTASSTQDAAARLSELIRFEMTLSARVLRYLRDAKSGRVDPNRLSGYHDFALRPFDGRAELARLIRAKDTRAALEGAHPRGQEFKALRAELARLRGMADEGEPIEAGLLIKPGEMNAELPKFLRLIAQELSAPEHADLRIDVERRLASEVYSEELVAAVRAVQEAKGLKPDGIVGARTIRALAGISRADQIDKLEIALEQLRWLPRELGSTRVFINQPAFTASYVQDGEEKLSMRTVIGTPANQTSFFYDEIEQVDYNPYWGVPQSILINEMLPRLRRDPGYLDRAGYEVTDAKGRKISSSAVNWRSYSASSPLNVRQTPSEANALGELKILFPNKHAIYMHDTPAKALFNEDVRAFSHGCVRLHDPRGMAAAVLGTTVEHVAEKLEQGHSTEKVKERIPVYVAYFTAWPDAAGQVRYFADVYERDKHLDAALAEIAEARAASS